MQLQNNCITSVSWKAFTPLVTPSHGCSAVKICRILVGLGLSFSCAISWLYNQFLRSWFVTMVTTLWACFSSAINLLYNMLWELYHASRWRPTSHGMYWPNFSSRDDLFLSWSQGQTSPEHGPCMQWQLTQTVRPQNEMVGCFNITASLDHLDYNCVVVAGSVHVLGQCVKWSFRQEIKAYFHFWWVRRMSPFRSPFRVLQWATQDNFKFMFHTLL